MSLPIAIRSAWPLLLLLLVPLLWWLSVRTRTSLSRRHLLVTTALRSLAVIMLALR